MASWDRRNTYSYRFLGRRQRSVLHPEITRLWLRVQDLVSRTARATGNSTQQDAGVGWMPTHPVVGIQGNFRILPAKLYEVEL